MKGGAWLVLAVSALTAMAQQDRCHAQSVRNLLACLLG